MRSIFRRFTCSRAIASSRSSRPTAVRDNASCEPEELRVRPVPLVSSRPCTRSSSTLAPIQRTPCSPGERAAAEWLSARLRSVPGVEVELEDEPSWGTFPPTATGLGLLGVLAAVLRLRGHRAAGALAAAITLAGIVDEAHNGPRVLRRLVRRRRTTVNLLARIGAADAPTTVVVLAHHDAPQTGPRVPRPDPAAQALRTRPPRPRTFQDAPAAVVVRPRRTARHADQRMSVRHPRICPASAWHGAGVPPGQAQIRPRSTQPRPPSTQPWPRRAHRPGARPGRDRAHRGHVAQRDRPRRQRQPLRRLMPRGPGRAPARAPDPRPARAARLLRRRGDAPGRHPRLRLRRHRRELDPATTLLRQPRHRSARPHLLMLEAEGPIWMEEYRRPLAARPLRRTPPRPSASRLHRGYRARVPRPTASSPAAPATRRPRS